MIAALFVDPQGVYSTIPGVDCWGEDRDARKYTGPHPVVAHPPCQRWGKFYHGSTRKPHQYRLGEDGGCFAAALTAVRNYGGALEHPADALDQQARHDYDEANDHVHSLLIAHQHLIVDVLQAVADSDQDVSPCGACSAPVLCIPDGLPWCEACARKESSR